jgi:hypothetical protein
MNRRRSITAASAAVIQSRSTRTGTRTDSRNNSFPRGPIASEWEKLRKRRGYCWNGTAWNHRQTSDKPSSSQRSLERSEVPEFRERVREYSEAELSRVARRIPLDSHIVFHRPVERECLAGRVRFIRSSRFLEVESAYRADLYTAYGHGHTERCPAS